MVWVRSTDRRYHLVESCPLLREPARPGDDEVPRDVREVEARRLGLARCHHCYGSAGRTA